MALTPGSRFDNYEIVHAIGAGGMAEVWLAKDLRLERQVALKLLPPDLTTHPTRVKRFEQEARAASALNHPNVCTIHALGITDDGRHFIAMEYVEGQTLRDRLAYGSLNRRELLDVAIQIASALIAAHAAGIVHRDLKPENVMLQPDGFVKVLDFGLAKFVAADSDPTMATETVLRTDAGTAVGTVSYMSPEQARGQRVDARTDIWALGVVVYEMIASRRPFAGQSTSDVLAAILERDPAPLARVDPEAPPELQRIVTKALRKDPEQRYQVMKDLLLDLQTLRDEVATSATAQRAVTVGTETRRRLAGRVTVVIIVLVLSAALWRLRTPPIGQSTVPQPTVNRPLTRLTFDPGLQIGATFSPDGRSIAYASDRAGNFDIWIQSVAGDDARQLTTSTSQESEPAWAPDGQTIVFRSEQDGGALFSVPVTGGSVRQLTNFGAHPIWVPGRAEILFRSGPPGVDYGFRLYAVSSDGTSSPRELLYDFLAGGLWPWIAPHPDGRISAYGVHPTRGEGFFTISRDGRTVTESTYGKDFPLQVAEVGTRLARFQWNGDGTGLYIEAFLKEVRNLWKVKVNPATLGWISAERLTTGMGADVGLSLSRDGRSVAFTMLRKSTRLWTYPFDSVTSRMRGVGRPVTAEDGRVSNMALSSDGRWLAYNLARAGSATSTGALWARDLETDTSVMLSENASFPAWSRNSRQIAYTLYKGPDSSGRLTTAVATRDIEGPERVIAKWSEKFILMPWDWVGSGQDLVASYSLPLSTSTKLVFWPTQSGAVSTPRRVLVEAPGRHFWQARFSPNDRWVAFCTQEAQELDRSQVYVMRAGGAQAADWVRVAAEHAWADKPRWAPDGRTLYFLSRHGSEFLNLWGTRFDPENGRPSGTPFAITHFDSPGLMISPDVGDEEWGVAAGRAVLTMVSATGNIWMLEHVERETLQIPAPDGRTR